MFNIKSILKFVATPAGILVVAIIIIQLLYSRNNKLSNEVKELRNKIEFRQTVESALRDSIGNIGTYNPLPETIIVDIPVPVFPPMVIETAGDTIQQKPDRPYVRFDFQEQWEKWYRDNCTGFIEFDTTQIWDNDKGARAQGQFYYGIDTDQRNWLLITPAGNWDHKPAKEGFRGGIEWLLSTSGDISIGCDITWRKWGPAARIDILEFSNVRGWLGIRRSY
jgi:hypothetical protein